MFLAAVMPNIHAGAQWMLPIRNGQLCTKLVTARSCRARFHHRYTLEAVAR
ncbi:MAG TPA: hypothetical protein VGG30_07430 [Pirellulales bacterium]